MSLRTYIMYVLKLQPTIILLRRQMIQSWHHFTTDKSTRGVMCSSAWIPHCGAKSSSHPCRGGSHCGFPGSWWTLPHPSPTSPHQLHTGPEQTQGSQYLMITLMNSQSQDNSVTHLEFVGEIYWSSTLIFKRAHYFFFFLIHLGLNTHNHT